MPGFGFFHAHIFFYENFPEYTLNVIATENCIDLGSNEADVVVRYGLANDEQKAEVYLFQEDYYPVVSRSLVIDGVEEPTISDLKTCRLLDVKWESSNLDAPSWKRWFELGNYDGYDNYMISNVDAYELAFHAVSRAHAASLISRTIINSEDFGPELIVLKGPSLPGYAYRVVTTKGGKRKKAVQDFIRWLQSEKDK